MRALKTFLIFIFVGMVTAFAFAPVNATAADCVFSSVLNANPASVDTRDAEITFNITITYPISCQNTNKITSLKVFLKAYDPVTDSTARNQRDVTVNTVSFNGKDRLAVQGSFPFFSLPAFSAWSKIGLIGVRQDPNNAPTNGYTNSVIITTTAPPAPVITPPPVPVPPVPGYDNPVDVHKPLLVGKLSPPQPLKDATVGSLLNRAVAFMLSFIAILAVVFIIIGGFRLAFSQGNTEAVTAGRKTITWAIVGLVIALLAFAMVRILDSILFS